MHRYGQAITWGPSTAPALFTGTVLSYSLRDAVTRQLIGDGNEDYVAMALHSRKAELNYEAGVTSGSTDFLDLSEGAKIVVSGISTGTVLATRAVERWSLGQRKIASIAATWFPDVTGGSGASAGTDLSADTPEQTLAYLYPSAALVYGTEGLSHASGIIHGLTLEQQWSLAEDDVDPDGTIKGVAAHGYLRTLQLEVLAKSTIPAVQAVLAITGAPAHAGGYRIESAEERFATAKGKMYAVNAIWVPALS